MSRNYVTNFRGDSFYTPNEKIKIKDEPETPIDEDFGDHNNLDFDFESDFLPMKKSMSMSDITALREQSEYDRHYSDESRVRGHPCELTRTKFVSMAEAIYRFQKDTPSRYHSTRPQLFRSSSANTGRACLTRPQSPTLRSKARSRPLHVISQKEKEEMELEEIKKHKIKAHPIPKSILVAPQSLPEVPKKPCTIIEPFNLTEIQKIYIGSPHHVPAFKARPAPKHILEKPDIPVQMTKAISPKFHKKCCSKEKLNDKTQHINQKGTEKDHMPTERRKPMKPEPFSFEQRNEELKKRKEERIRRQIEEEKKQASSFKAQPLPGAVKKHMHTNQAKCSSSSTSSENKENDVMFKAKPATVLYKEPFKPILQPLHTDLVPFHLMTEKRASEREKYDKQLKEIEQEKEIIRQQREKELKEMQDRAEAEMRAKSVHHAKPVPDLAVPFIPERSTIPLTVPETPTFVRRLRQH